MEVYSVLQIDQVLNLEGFTALSISAWNFECTVCGSDCLKNLQVFHPIGLFFSGYWYQVILFLVLETLVHYDVREIWN